MPFTVFHASTATTPDNPAVGEIGPLHWNSAHVGTLSAQSAAEIFGAFSNDPAYNVSFTTIAGNKVVASANVTAAPSPVNVTGVNGSSVNAQTIQFGNSNGLTLGVSTAANGATITGSYTVPAVPTAYVSSLNGSSGAISLNVGSSLSSSTNGSSITFGLASNITTALQSAGAYLTTAAQSNQVVNSLNGSTGQISLNVGSSLSASTNGSSITFGLASNITTALQSAGAYLTTARASNDAVGLNSAVSNVTATINSSGLSLDARGYAGTSTGFAGANISGSLTHNSLGINLSLSVAAPGGGGNFSGGVSNVGNTSGQTGVTGTRVVFAGGNNVTLSQLTDANGATITISGANAGGAQTGISSVALSDTTYSSGQISFRDGNGISWASTTGQGISITHGLQFTSATSAITSNALHSTASRVFNAIAATNNTGGGTASLSSNVSFSAANGLTFYTSAGNAIVGSYTVPTVPTAYVSSVNGSSGAISLNVGSSLSSSTNGSSITFGLASNITTALQSAGAYLTTARASTDAIGLNTAQTNVTWTVNSSGISLNAAGYAGTGTSATNATLTLNSNGLAISVAAPGAATLTVSAVGNTTVNSSGTWPNAISARAYGILSIGTSNGSLLFSTPDPVDFTYLSVGNSNLGNTAGDTGVFSQRMVLVGSNNITLSGSSNGGSVTLSIIGAGGGAGGVAISAGTQSVSTGTMVFSNSNGISFGMSGSSRITASYTVPTNVTAFAVSNTTQSSTGTIALSSLIFAGAGVASVGVTNGSVVISVPSGGGAESNAVQLLGANTAGNTTASGTTIGWSGLNLTLSGTNASQVVISAPATSSLVGTSGMSISTNGSTISVFPQPRGEWNNMGQLAVAQAAQANSLVSIQPFRLEWPLAFSNVAFPLSVTVANAANNSTAYIDVSASGVIYSRNVSTLSSVASFSGSFTQSWTSNATGTANGLKALTATMAGVTLTPGNYWLAIHMSTNNTATGGANTTALGNTVSMILASTLSTNLQNFAIWNGASNATQGVYSGLGIISTGATLATLALSSITVSGTSALNAPVAFALRNATY